MRWLILSWRDGRHPEAGGSEVYLEQVARELVRRGHQVTLYCARPAGLPDHDEVAGVRVIRHGGRLGVYPRGLLWLARRRRDFDVVVDVINGVPFATPLVRRRGVIALVHHLHREQWRIIYPGLLGRLGWFLERRVTPALYRRRDFLTVSAATRDDLVSLGIPRASIRIARNGLDSRRLSVPRTTHPSICVLARHVPHKRIEHALAVLGDLRAELPGLRLDLIGDGWWTRRLVEEAERRGVADAVTFHGHLSDQDRDLLLARAWMMLLPSAKEGWGLAVMEAAGQGTPTVAYRYAGGVAESVLDGVTGLLADDEPGLTEHTRTLLRSTALRVRLGEAAAERAQEFSWAHTADVVEELGRSVRSGRRS